MLAKRGGTLPLTAFPNTRSRPTIISRRHKRLISHAFKCRMYEILPSCPSLPAGLLLKASFLLLLDDDSQPLLLLFHTNSDQVSLSS